MCAIEAAILSTKATWNFRSIATHNEQVIKMCTKSNTQTSLCSRAVQPHRVYDWRLWEANDRMFLQAENLIARFAD